MSRPPVSWVTDTMLTDRMKDRSGFPTIAEAAAELGYPVYQTTWVRERPHPDPAIPFGEGCVVTYGTHPFVRQISQHYARQWQPGAFSQIEKHSFSATSAHLGDLMLNSNYVILPYGEALRRGFDMFGDAYFLKPDSVTKAFTGFVMTREKFHTEVATLNLYPELLCVLAKPIEIEAEFRFVIADREVVTGSQYRWDDRPDIRLDVLPICQELAAEVARHEWQPDRVYVCDVALLNGRSQAKVVELNTFSSAGFYSCDTRAIVEAVSHAAYRDYLGED